MLSNSPDGMENDAAFDPSTSVDQVANFVDRIKENPKGQAHALIPLLSEQNPVYRDRSTGEMVRMRGYAMATLELTGLPEDAFPYILESLESEFHPYLVAAAARSLRGMERPHPQIAPFLVKAIYNIWGSDNPVSFDSFHVKWPQKKFSTALIEIFKSLAYFGGYAQKVLPDLEHLNQFYADKFSNAAQVSLIEAIEAIKSDEQDVDTGCCKLPLIQQGIEEHADSDNLSAIPSQLTIQDQDGTLMEWNQFFSQKPTVLAFFYTRCGNPRKCTQTIFNLAAIRKQLDQAGLVGKVRIAAITYDPKFDTPGARKSYGNARKFKFDDDSRMLRIPDKFDQVVKAFRLGVNFIDSQVNVHRVELFLLNSKGKLARSFLRIQSEPEQVIDALRPLISSDHNSL